MPNASAPAALVVDDQETVRAQIAFALRSLGVSRVLEAADGAEALAILGHTPPDEPILVLVDLQMPGMDGIELMRRLAENAGRVTVALVSGAEPRVLRAAAQLSREYGLQLGGCFAKPVSANQLRPLVDRMRTGEMDGSPRAESEVEDLARALRAGEIVPYYQPVIDLATGAVAGVEALARWHHPDRGLIAPKDFIALSEQSGLITRLTEVMMTRALVDLAALEAAGHPLRVAINLSARGVDRPDLPDAVEARTRVVGIDPDRVTFEITETQLTANPLAFLEVVSRFRLKGFRLSIDDFGTGQSTLEQLRRLPFTELKVDSTFMRGALGDPLSKAILESCVDVARRLELHVVAEGIETEDCLTLARDLGCDQGQGYHISHPLPVDALRTWLDARRAAPPGQTACA